MTTTRLVVAALVIAGIAGSVPAASAKKHHKSHTMSTKKGSTSQGNVGPGTNNNNTAPSK
ncbi:MAG: hypothetical protein WA303_03680 [Bradyrhizobium sp.]